MCKILGPKKHSCYNCFFLCAQFNHSDKPYYLHLLPDLKKHLLQGYYSDGKVPHCGCAANVIKDRKEIYKEFFAAKKQPDLDSSGSLVCYKSVWDIPNTVDLADITIIKLITQNRKHKCFFYKNNSTLFWPAAEELEKREKEWDYVKLPVRISFWAIVISFLGIIVPYIIEFSGCMPNPTINIDTNKSKPIFCEIVPTKPCNTPPNSSQPSPSEQDTCSTSKPTKK